jgi:hypothetical protein
MSYGRQGAAAIGRSWFVLVLILVIGAGLLASCGSKDEGSTGSVPAALDEGDESEADETEADDDESEADGSESESDSEPEESEPGSSCDRAKPTLVRAINTGLNGVRLRKAYIVRSDDFAKVYFVSGRIGGEIGTWATNSPGGTGVIFSVGDAAHRVSDWGPGETTDAELSLEDSGARHTIDCAAGREE